MSNYNWAFRITDIDLIITLRSAAKLTYGDAQDIIEGKILGQVPVTPEHNAADIAHDIRTLNDLATQLRSRRLQGGCLSTDSLRLTFKLDENGLPVDCNQEERSEANNLVEEVSLTRCSGGSTMLIHDEVYAPYQHGSCTADCCSLSRTGPPPPP